MFNRAASRQISRGLRFAPLGYTIDLCKQVTKSIEQQFGLQELKIEWVPAGKV